MPDDQKEPTVTISMSRKLNLENLWGPKFKYESAEVFVSVKDVRAGMTPDEIAALMDTGRVAWDQVRASLAEQVAKVKEPPTE